MKDDAQGNRLRTGLFAAWAGVLMLLALPLIAAAADNAVEFGVPPWPGERVKAEVATQILDTIGYDASVTNASWIIALQGVASGDLDVDLGIWKPTQNSTVDPMLKKGKVELVAVNIKDAKYDMVVPQYVCDAGVTAIGDLNSKADKFGSKVYGIEAGNDGNQIVIDAINNDVYNLGGWKLVPSSTAVMLIQAQRAYKNHEWIVFLGWKPHWMNIVMDLCYLKDPKKIWGGASTVNTVANPEFLKSHPNVAQFLRNLVIPADVQSNWIYTYSYKEVPLEKTASDWIKANMDRVLQWLEGVQTADGRPAGEVFKAQYDGG